MIEARKRIAEARKANSTALDLRNIGLTSLPSEIGSLTALKHLHLDGNQLPSLPPEIGSLTTLS